MRNTHLVIHTNVDGMTVADLKEIIAGWPDTDADGKPCKVLLGDGEGRWGQLRKVEAEKLYSGSDLKLDPCAR